MTKQLTLGSLFDGISGFPLAGMHAGIAPIWASEIEPFPIRVTNARIPQMKHYGDIRRLHGDDLEPVDIITFGSPCTDLSIAGKRTGLHGAQSSLFFEAVRVITEMRKATNGKYPRWVVWENVPAALSASSGRDFREILENLVKIKETESVIPMPETGKWLSAGEIRGSANALGDHYSIAWRILDAAKGWGVAQRRRRIFLVVDLDGQRAGSVLFESEGLSGYTPPGTQTRQSAAGSAAVCAGATRGAECGAVAFEPGLLKREGGHSWRETTGTLRADPGDNAMAVAMPRTPKAYSIGSDQSKGMLSPNPRTGIYEADTSRTLDCGGANPSCNQGGISVVAPVYCTRPRLNTVTLHNKSPSLMARDYKDPPIVGKQSIRERPTYCIGRAAYSQGVNSDFNVSVKEEQAQALTGEGPGAVATQNDAEYIVRRLTPGECCRLMGFPDGWTECLGIDAPTDADLAYWRDIFIEWYRVQGKTSKPPGQARLRKWLSDPRSDTAEYKAYGNSVAVPCVFFVLAGIVWAEETEE